MYRTTKPNADAHLGTDANVLFSLNLPPNIVVNHPEKGDITLAYDQKSRKIIQRNRLQKSEIRHI
ncbi:hypothetical protein EB837_06095 [Kluyvera ascorbata]|uniref:Uncharacterized protein n=1 Tax=Kluyvera ascorbata TaxID=51288 RepID=A0A3N2SAB6_9ENTR|nr:hypothetical protein EB837_06095 [Kluyvera ascorbata]